MFIAGNHTDYSVLDTGDGKKLERWGKYVLSRPDPQVIWPATRPELWSAADAEYIRSSSGGGEWRYAAKLPERWVIGYGRLRFFVRPTGFKHTGLFPEQAANWDVMSELIKKRGGARVLNLFAYTGGATAACAAAGASVAHIDAAKSMVGWAKENLALSGLKDAPVRYIADDCAAFVHRELRRGAKYDGIVMDPPSYGRANGKVWKVENDVFELARDAAGLLSDRPLFFFINSYTTGLSPIVTANILSLVAPKGGTVSSGELVLPTQSGGVLLPCGATARWIATP